MRSCTGLASLWQVTKVYLVLVLRATLLRTVDYFDHQHLTAKRLNEACRK